MATMLASDVAYSITDRRRMNSAPGRFFSAVKLTFPVTNNQYPASGIPLTPANLGMPGKQLTDLSVIGQVTGAAAATTAVEWTYDATNQTLRGFQVGAAVSTPLAELATGAVVASTVLTVEALGY